MTKRIWGMWQRVQWRNMLIALLMVSGMLAAPGSLIGATWAEPTRAISPIQPTQQCPITHAVRPGETLLAIARAYGVDAELLAQLNRIRDTSLIYVGHDLCIPSDAQASTATIPPPAPTPDEPTSQPSSPSVHYQPSVVVLWNEVMLAAVRNGAPRPTVTTRSLFMVHIAMYDAWSAYDATARPMMINAALRRPEAEHTDVNKAAAVSQAAYQVLINLYSAYEEDTGAFGHLLSILGYEPVASVTNPALPQEIGFIAAQAVLSARADDGANAANNYADMLSETFPRLYVPVNAADPTDPRAVGGPDFDPNRWQPLRVPTGALTDPMGVPVVDDNNPLTYQDQLFLTPQWGAVTPFALQSGDQFRPPAPPQAGVDAPYVDALGQSMTNDEAYNLQVDELLALSADLTDEQKVIAEYWIDGPRSETPPGHWNSLAHGISERDRHGIDEDVRLYFALNGALLDAGIAAWDAKRYHDYVRPFSAIRQKYAGQAITAWGGYGRGTVVMLGEQWQPYQSPTFVTPPFGEYVSGHSTFSAAAAVILTLFTGSERFYDGTTVLYYEDYNSDGVPDMLGQHIAAVNSNRLDEGPSTAVILRWDTFQDAADEAGVSRRYGGIHFQDGDLYGREMGQEIGEQAFRLAEQYWTGTVP